MKRLDNPNRRRRNLLRTCALVAVCACGHSAGAQETRADLLTEDRAAKTQQTDDSSAGLWLDRTFAVVESQLQNWSGDGLHPVMGGMIPGTGIAIGPGYRHHLFGNRAIVDASGAVSTGQSWMMRSRLEWPRLLADRLSLGGDLRYQDFTQVNFFGIGDNSQKMDQTNYRLKGLDVLGFAAVHPGPWLSISGRVGVLRRLEVSAGTSSVSPSTGSRFDEVAAPGLTQQPDSLHADVSLDVDTRDLPGNPASGGRYRLSISSFHDQNLGQFSFRRLDADAAQYVPLFHKSRVLTLHGRAAFSQTAQGQEVPFYWLPALGGSNTLRGFLDYRFRDRDLLLFNAEYRWPIFRALDGALFYDAGTVAPTARDLSMRHAHSDYGLGIRLHTAKRMLVAVDVARSPEGIRSIVSFTTPLGAPSRTVAPYAP